MKVIRNNVCYVEIEDIVNLDSIPDGVLREFKTHYTSRLGFEKFVSKEAIEFFKNQRSIVDYDSISRLNSLELNQKINFTYQEFERCDLEKEQNNLTFQEIGHLLENLEHYQLRKEEYDDEIKNLSFYNADDYQKVKIKNIA